ncbi:MAG: FAD-dependent monooxygenase [Pseudomonadota bacterium]
MRFDVCVVGGGTVGCAAALGFSQLGYSVLWITKPAGQAQHQQPDYHQSLPVYMLTRASMYILQHLGIWAQISTEISGPVYDMQIWDAHNTAQIQFPKPADDGPMAWTVPHAALVQACKTHVASAKNIHFVAGTISHVVNTPAGATLQTVEGGHYEVSLLCAADGEHSWVRAHLDMPIQSKPYNQTAWTTRVHHSGMHHQCARQRFSSEGPLAFLPMHNPQESAIVWSLNNPPDSEAALDRALQIASEGILGMLERSIPWKQDVLVERHAEQYAVGSTVLLGDAAHRLHPLAGQGLNLGLLDVACLLEQFHDEPDNVFKKQRKLSRYARLRRGHNTEMIQTMWMLHQGYLNQSHACVSMRGFGMTVLDHAAFIKRSVVEYAMGRFPGAPTWAKVAP